MRRNTAFILRRRHNRGLSLIELMISITIGLILIVAILSAYVGTSGASKVSEAQGRMNEDAQAALTILSQQIRMAGNNPRQLNYDTATPSNPVFGTTSFAIRGCDGTFSNIDSATDIQSLTCAAAGSDSLAVSYEADPFNTARTTGGAATDCLGTSLPVVGSAPAVFVNKWNGIVGAGSASVPTSVTYTVADNRFFIATSGVITAPSLYCKGNGTGSTKQPLVENIEDMQFIYGTAPATTTTMSVAGYLNAGEILTETNMALLPDDQTRWGKVMTVRVCVLVRSEAPIAPDADSARYMSCPTSSASGGTLTVAPDLRLRRAYSTTVVLRNRVAP